MIYVLKLDQPRDDLPTRARLVGPFNSKDEAQAWGQRANHFMGWQVVDLDYPVVLAYTPASVDNLEELARRLGDEPPPITENRAAVEIVVRNEEARLHLALGDARWSKHRLAQLRSLLGEA